MIKSENLVPDFTKEINLTPAQIERFWRYVTEAENGCWLWSRKTDSDGYGIFALARRSFKAHRVAWTLTNGPIPKGQRVCHNCPTGDNPSCCNPEHLFLGTNADNSADMVRKNRAAKGSNNGSRLYPERLVRGSANKNSKLTDDEIPEIRMWRRLGFSFPSIGRAYDVSHPTIQAIINGKTWSHV